MLKPGVVPVPVGADEGSNVGIGETGEAERRAELKTLVVRGWNR